jgi:predicted enzyme related to lactoylglutathione lyase
MEKITGIGGFFFKSKDPDLLNEWYETHFGITRCATEYEAGSWWQDEGPTVFGAVKSNEIGESESPWYLNFRVGDLDAMVAQLRGAGIEVNVEGEIHPNGRFAHLKDPEGTLIELWEPAGADLERPR